ncbi:MAG: sugar transferase [Vicingus serpentipes]|nr:sugar transferase [Vicingus serpentipes]
MGKRIFDIILSLFGLILLFPLFILIALLIIIDSKGGVFYIQKRIGKNGITFNLFKFRTMSTGSDKEGLLTVGNRDARITKVGYYLRKYKIDELPQLINVLNGKMSFVGPRPEVSKYVELYTEEQREILKLKPGITDYASLEYFNENELLAMAKNPEAIYINEILPAKIRLNKKYIANKSFITDCTIILKTVFKVFR